MRVLALHLAKQGSLPNACQIYRTNMPLGELEKHGWLVQWDYYEALKEQFEKQGISYLIRYLERFELVILPRACAPTEKHRLAVASLFEILRRLGKRIVYEVDDDFTNDHRDLRHMGIDNAMEIASWCDAITVTTPYLADLMRKRTRRPVYVLPNTLDPLVWKKPAEREPGPLRIGLSGSPTHEGDWRVLATVLPVLLQEHSVEVMLAGYYPDYIRDLPGVRNVAAMDYLTYSSFVKQCDIVLAPVDPDDKFNLSKSPIKAVEGQGSARTMDGKIIGAAVVATDTPVYRLAIQSGTTGLLSGQTPDQWLSALRQVITDTDLRLKLQTEGYKAVWKRYDLAKEWVQWARAYQQIATRPLLSVKLPIHAVSS